MITLSNILSLRKSLETEHAYLPKFRIWLIAVLLLSSPIFAFAQSDSPLQAEISYPYLERLISIAKKNYPEVKSMATRVDAAEKAVKGRKLAYFDIVSFSYILTPSNIVSTVNPELLAGYQFGFFLNIGNILQKPLQVKLAKKQLEGVLMDRDTYLLNLEANVKQRYFTYVRAKATYKIASNLLLDAKNMAAGFKYRFEKGEVTFEEYNTALMSVSTGLQTQINYESEVLIAKSQLEELVGQKLENIR